MFNRHYFETVLSQQLEFMEHPARLTVQLNTGATYVVHALLAAHDQYVILRVYSDGKEARYGKSWQRSNPGKDAAIYDQVAIPYAIITMTHLTARSTKGDDAQNMDAESAIGFRQA